jgi:RNA-directed DNA polymerase
LAPVTLAARADEAGGTAVKVLRDLGQPPIIRGWGNYYRRAKVRRLYHRLNRWIVLRVWNHQHKHWRNAGWRYLPERRLYGELGLVNLLQLIPSMESYYRQKGYAR